MTTIDCYDKVMEGGDILITYKDVMDKYKVSRTTVQKWVKDGMPFYKIGKSVRFDEKEIDSWIRGVK